MAVRVAARVPPELLRRGRVLRPVDAADVYSNPRAEFVRLERAGALHRLAPGLFAVVPDDRVGRDWRRVVTVAREAIATEGYVLVVENGRTSMRAVILGASLDGGRVEVLSGLSPGGRLARPAR